MSRKALLDNRRKKTNSSAKSSQQEHRSECDRLPSLLINSGAKDELTMSMTLVFTSGLKSLSGFWAPRTGKSEESIVSAPRFEVRTMRVFLKSTLRPWASVRNPSSRTCNRSDEILRCAFSNSSLYRQQH